MDNISKLSAYIPEKAAPVVAGWIDAYKAQLKISRPRRTKLGDYRPPYNGHSHRISVNADLNPYAFLVTLVHEFAHLVTWNHHGNKAKSHGKEWKTFFRRMMQPFFEAGIFPEDIRAALTRYLENPAAASCTDLQLLRTLKKYDRVAADATACAVEQLPDGALFHLYRASAATSSNGSKSVRIFKKGHRLRKRYHCTEIATGRIYLFNPLAEVLMVE